MPRSPLREQRRLHIPEMGYFLCSLCEKAAEAPCRFCFYPHVNLRFILRACGARLCLRVYS
jgi:hypothetical protein